MNTTSYCICMFTPFPVTCKSLSSVRRRMVHSAWWCSIYQEKGNSYMKLLTIKSMEFLDSLFLPRDSHIGILKLIFMFISEPQAKRVCSVISEVQTSPDLCCNLHPKHSRRINSHNVTCLHETEQGCLLFWKKSICVEQSMRPQWQFIEKIFR